MCSSKLRCFDPVEHRIVLTQDSRHSCSVPYRARPKTRKAGKVEIQKQVEADVINLSATEWPQ